MKVKSESESEVVSDFSDPMDCSLPGSSVHGFSRQEHWSGVPLPSPYIYVGIDVCVYILCVYSGGALFSVEMNTIK